MLKTRIITAAGLVAIALVCVLWLPSWLAALLFGAVWTLGAVEWGRLAQWRPGAVAIYAGAFVLLALGSGSWFDAIGAQRVAIAACCWWVLAFAAVVAYPWPIPAYIVAAAGLLALVPSWFLLVYVHGIGPTGPTLVLGVLFVIWAADVGAYFVGRRFGRVKLAPSVSPGKTWEGVLGGLAGAVCVAVLAGAWAGQPLLSWAATGFAAALASIVGDLTVSVCKRRAGKKDSGELLPGHGGVLDRIDSLTAAIPVYFLGMSLAGLIA